MKLKRIIFLLTCVVFWTVAHTQEVHKVADTSIKSSKFYRPDSVHGLFSYSNFNYNNDTPTLLSNFQGSSYLSLIGANNFKINNSTFFGLFFYNLNTYLNFTQSPLASTAQTIHNNSLVAHVFKQIKPNLSTNFVAGYGQNSLGFDTFETITPANSILAYGKSKGNTWYANLKGIYNHSWTNVSLISHIGVLYAQVNQEALNYIFVSGLAPATFVPGVTSQSTFLQEFVELTYRHNPKIMPFINAGLIQVLQNSNSTPVSVALSAGSLPNQTIDLNQNGFSIGAGFSWKIQKFSLRLEEQYYQRGTVYSSYQSTASIRYQI